MTTIKRKLYKRGSSYETTIPMPLLFAVDKSKKQEVLFNYDAKTGRWYIDFKESSSVSKDDSKKGRKKK